MTHTIKVPGWGFILPDRRVTEEGEEQALILPEAEEAPYWESLEAIAYHRGRVVYRENCP